MPPAPRRRERREGSQREIYHLGSGAHYRTPTPSFGTSFPVELVLMAARGCGYSSRIPHVMGAATFLRGW
jgi:hypothetical protein